MENEKRIDTKSTIFITIAACQEYFIEHTIKSAISLSSNPDRVFFGVFNNILDKEKSLIDKDFFNNSPNIFYAELITSVPMGVGFGRMNASLLSTKQHDYVLQIDAHTVFTKDWDLKLIKNFNDISKESGSDRIILTAIPRGNLYYDIRDRESLFSDDDVFKGDPNTTIDIYNNDYHKFADLPAPYINTKPQIKFDGWQGNHFTESMVGFPVTYGTETFEEDLYAEVNCIHASLVFFKYDLIRKIMHDPEDPFHGDQVNYALRILSRGYKIFAIKEPLLLTLNKYTSHEIKNSNVGQLSDPEWNWRSDLPVSRSSRDYLDRLQMLAEKQYLEIFSGQYLGYWGAPDKTSLLDAKNKMGFLKKYDQEV
jgi:hypothetical protein